jgi:hypothetical protein
MEGRLPETVLKGGAGIRLTPFRKPLALLAKRREPPPRWGFGGLKIFFHPPGPGRLRDWLRGPPLVREIY